MTKVLVIDDEPHAAEVLEHYIAQTSQLKLVASCRNPIQALPLHGTYLGSADAFDEMEVSVSVRCMDLDGVMETEA